MILKIEPYSNSPIYEQIRNQIVMGIAQGHLQQGERLASVRNLAEDIGVNLHTVNKAYQLLRDEGYLKLDRRSGTVISFPKKDESFTNILKEKLYLSAAESICSGMDKEEFMDFCQNAYKYFKRGEK